MNFEGFDKGTPSDWEGTVRHEFGHALGLEHEHQHPEGGCDAEWRWNDDAGYIPTRDKDGGFTRDKQGRYPVSIAYWVDRQTSGRRRPLMKT
jgi:hypothetical protein